MKKTAVEGIIERIKQLSITCDSPDSKWLVDMLLRDIENGTEFDKSFLNIEKDQMIFAFNRGHSDVICTLSGIKKKQCTGEEFYKEYFSKL
jgi:hypothetical protein